jgi:hypothetical protein
LADDATLSRWLSHRARSERYRVHPGVLGELAEDRRVSVGGAKALAAIGGLAEGSEPLTLYVDAADKDKVVADFGASRDEAGNVHFAVIAHDVPLQVRPQPGKPASVALAHVDALASPDARARSIASEWLRSVRKPLTEK